jgi:2-dehydro-3-deoxyglucarate aldolase/4-hydroxy-2-oxoheptanedioate aldolase
MEAIMKFRSDLRAGRICLGTGISFTDPLVSEALCGAVDFLWIDLEHSPMSPEAMSGHLLAARGKGVPALVRVSAGTTPLIKGALDAGAEGIIVPQVRSVEEVRQIINDCRYPPLGQRGYGPRVPAGYFRSGGREFTDQANQTIFVSVMIETAEAFAALDDILAVPGLDSVVIGPNDLSYSLGALGDVEHPKVVAAIETIAAKTRAAGRFVGAGMGTDAHYAYTMAKRGVQWLQVGSDCVYLYRFFDLVRSAFCAEWEGGQGNER